MTAWEEAFLEKSRILFQASQASSATHTPAFSLSQLRTRPGIWGVGGHCRCRLGLLPGVHGVTGGSEGRRGARWGGDGKLQGQVHPTCLS